MVTPSDAGDRDMRVRWFRAALAVSFLATLGLSHALWVADRRFPVVPVLEGLPQPGHFAGLALLGLVAAALIAVALAPPSAPSITKWSAGIVVAIGILWAFLDQMRWQPYFITFMLATACLMVREMRVMAIPTHRLSSLAPFQLAIAATYIWSGVHKLNFHYLQHGGLWLLGPALRRIDFIVPAPLLTLTALGTALTETALGFMLLGPRTRRIAVLGLTAMHIGIMLRIGPLGGSSNSVVWPWNVFMVAALWLLMWPRDMGERFDSSLRSPGSVRPWPLRIMWIASFILFVLGPALNFVNAWDDLTSFQLYAAKQPYVRISYAPEHRAKLEEFGLRDVEVVPGRVDLTRWSGRELNAVPLIEPRVLERIGSELARAAPEANLRMQIAGPPALFTGKRRFAVWAFPPPDYRKEDVTASSRIDWRDPHEPVKPARRKPDR